MQLYIWLWFCLVTQLGICKMLHEQRQGKLPSRAPTAIHAHSQIGPLISLVPLMLISTANLMHLLCKVPGLGFGNGQF
jgi:hypothetical protein